MSGGDLPQRRQLVALAGGVVDQHQLLDSRRVHLQVAGAAAEIDDASTFGDAEQWQVQMRGDDGGRQQPRPRTADDRLHVGRQSLEQSLGVAEKQFVADVAVQRDDAVRIGDWKGSVQNSRSVSED